MKKVLYLVVAATLVAGMMIHCTPASAKPIVLKIVTFLPSSHMQNEPIKWFVEEVNKRSEGEIVVNYVGGPEVIPAKEIHEAVRTGVIDMGVIAGSYVRKVLPVTPYYVYVDYEPWEERETGLFDFWAKDYKEAINSAYLGNWAGCVATQYFLFTNELVDEPKKLKGLKFRATSLYMPIYNAMGIIPVSIGFSEIYTGMERGVIDGFAWPLHSGITAMGFSEVTKYCIDHGFWRSSAATVINMDRWNSIPKHLQNLLMDASIKTEHFAAEFFTNALQQERKRLKDAGMKFIKFSPNDAEWFMSEIRKAQWEEMENRVGPEKTAMLRKLFSRDALKK